MSIYRFLIIGALLTLVDESNQLWLPMIGNVGEVLANPKDRLDSAMSLTSLGAQLQPVSSNSSFDVKECYKFTRGLIEKSKPRMIECVEDFATDVTSLRDILPGIFNDVIKNIKLHLTQLFTIIVPTSPGAIFGTIIDRILNLAPDKTDFENARGTFGNVLARIKQLFSKWTKKFASCVIPNGLNAWRCACVDANSTSCQSS